MFAKALALFLIALVAVNAQTNVNPTAAQLSANDQAALQLAYIAELLEWNFYVAGNAKYNTSASFPDPNVLSTLALIQSHENTHQAYVKGLLTAFGATVPVCSFNFAAQLATNVTYLQNAYILENIGVQSYNGLINTIFNQSLIQLLGTITTMEARHAGWLAQFNLTSVTPQIYAQSIYAAFTPAVVVSTLNGVVNCTGFTLTAPTVRTVQWVNTTAFNNTVPATSTNYAVTQNDIAVLQYAYLLETFEAGFYTWANNNWNFSNTTNFPGVTGAYLTLILGHEQSHVTALNAAIVAAQGIIYNECVFNYSSVTFATFLANAAAIEALGVSAYDGVLNATSNYGSVRQTALQIADIEAQHAGYLARLVGSGPTNVPLAAYDVPRDPSYVFNYLIGTGGGVKWISCGTWTPTIPRVLPVYPYQNNTATATSTSGSSTTFFPTSTSPADRATVSIITLVFSAIAAFLFL